MCSICEFKKAYDRVDKKALRDVLQYVLYQNKCGSKTGMCNVTMVVQCLYGWCNKGIEVQNYMMELRQ